MASGNLKFYSEELNGEIELTLIFPEYLKKKYFSKIPENKLTLIYVLHGMTANHTEWLHKSQLEEYAKSINAVFVCINGLNEFYVNGQRFNFENYLIHELPQIIEKIFNVSLRREDRYIMGESMGGYGTLRTALTYPDKFAGAAAFSPAVNIQRVRKSVEETNHHLLNVFGEAGLVDKKNDLFNLIQKFNEQKQLSLKLFVCCGTEDFLYEQNEELDAFIHKHSNQFDYRYQTSSGEHNWFYWNTQIKDALSHLGLVK